MSFDEAKAEYDAINRQIKELRDRQDELQLKMTAEEMKERK